MPGQGVKQQRLLSRDRRGFTFFFFLLYFQLGLLFTHPLLMEVSTVFGVVRVEKLSAPPEEKKREDEIKKRGGVGGVTT